MRLKESHPLFTYQGLARLFLNGQCLVVVVTVSRKVNCQRSLSAQATSYFEVVINFHDSGFYVTGPDPDRFVSDQGLRNGISVI